MSVKMMWVKDVVQLFEYDVSGVLGESQMKHVVQLSCQLAWFSTLLYTWVFCVWNDFFMKL